MSIGIIEVRSERKRDREIERGNSEYRSQRETGAREGGASMRVKEKSEK